VRGERRLPTGKLNQLLVEGGERRILTSTSAVSADGTVIVGIGLNPSRQWEAFRATLPG
jgi:hypothetical protein